jgi:tripartite-type tricarboxylate transporter receptor subunit TctC
MAELGFKDFAIAPWVGFFLPAGTPREAVDTWNREINAVARTSEFAEAVARGLGMVPRGGTPEQFAALLKQDIAQTTQIIQSAGIKAQ